MKTKLSIIVPIYGVEQYLRKCVDSLLAQDICDYEIILVDDGSPDNCPQICDDYAAAHKNIRVIHRENGGLSAARNSGIKVAQGEYVCFVDSDDYWEPNVLEGLMAQVEKEQLDVLSYDYQNVRAVDTAHLAYEVFQPYKYPHKVDTRNEVVDGVTYLNERMCYECYAVMYIMRREIVPLFMEGIHFEDVEWLPRMMLKAKRVNSTQTIVYNYFWREGSITQTQGNKERIRKNLDDRMSIIAKYSELRKQNSTCAWLMNMQCSMVAGILTTVAREFYEERKEYIKRLREMNAFPLVITSQGKTYARRARIINALGPNAFCLLMRLAGVRCKV